MKISNVKISLLVLTPFLFGCSYFLISNYLYGDQIVYRMLYDVLRSASFSEILLLSKAYVSGGEPIPATLLWVGASLGLEKDFYISLFNTALMISLLYFLRINRATIFVVFLVMTNYYLLVLMTGAERLKFAYLILLLAANLKGKCRVLLLALGPLAHFQSAILLVGIGAGHASDAVKALFKRGVILKKHFFFTILLFLMAAILASFFGGGVLAKAAIYMRLSEGLSELFEVFILLGVALAVSKDRLRVFLALIPMIAAVFLLGGDRVNMMAFSVVFYFLALERRLSSPPFLLLLAYFSYKSIGFVSKVMVYGDGFYG